MNKIDNQKDRKKINIDHNPQTQMFKNHSIQIDHLNIPLHREYQVKKEEVD